MKMWVCAMILFILTEAVTSQMPLPFGREMYLMDPPMTGDDVFILQNLLNRALSRRIWRRMGYIHSAVQKAVSQLQSSSSELENTDIFDPVTAQYCLNKFSNDNIVWIMALLQRIWATSTRFTCLFTPIEVSRLKQLFSMATITFYIHLPSVRTEKRDDGETYPWPDWGSDQGTTV